MKTFKIALCLPLVGFIPLSAQADPQPDPAAFTAHVKKKPHYKKIAHKNYKVAEPRYAPAAYPVAAAIPAYAPHPYNWSGFFVGGYAGAGTDSRSPQLTVPTYGTLQGNDIGFAGSNFNNAYNVDSQPYNALANGTNSNAAAAGTLNGPFANGYTTYTATATANGYNSPVTGTSTTNNLTAATVSTTNNGNQTTGAGTTTYSYANVTPINNLNGNRSDSLLTTNSSTHRLLGLLGGELGYRRQFGQFVLGVEADGGYIDGRNTQTTNSTGQFYNSQGANTTATAAECTTINNVNNGNGTTTSSCSGGLATNSSTGNVTVVNNGNSSFSQSIQAGPQWLGTARLTAGVAMDRVMLYATGGFAYGEADLAVASAYRDTANSVCSGSTSGTTGVNGASNGSTNVSYACNGVANTGSSYTYSDAAQWSGSNSRLLTGFAVGSGMAYAMTDNIIFKLEGYYYNLGSISTTAYGTGTQTLTNNAAGAGGALPAGTNAGTRTASVTPYSVSRTVDGFIAKVGVQFKFDTGAPDPAPVVAKY